MFTSTPNMIKHLLWNNLCQEAIILKERRKPSYGYPIYGAFYQPSSSSLFLVDGFLNFAMHAYHCTLISAALQLHSKVRRMLDCWSVFFPVDSTSLLIQKRDTWPAFSPFPMGTLLSLPIFWDLKSWRVPNKVFLDGSPDGSDSQQQCIHILLQ
jgi:hypothetical protein